MKIPWNPNDVQSRFLGKQAGERGGGFLEIKELQLEAAKRMSAQNFVIGHKLAAGEVLGKK